MIRRMTDGAGRTWDKAAGATVGTLAGGGLGHYSKPLGKIASTFRRGRS